jgi:hypothetical protein
MTDEPLQAIVEEIGKLSDSAEASRWELADAIAAAYSELPLYQRGLTSGLCQRMKRSSDTVYGLRDASELRTRLLYVSDIPTSHFTTLAHLQDRFNLTNEDCISWLDWVKDTGASVREMSQEITTKYTEDGKKAFFKRLERVQKDVQRLWEEAETIHLPENLRALTKAALRVLKNWVEKLQEWKAAS